MAVVAVTLQCKEQGSLRMNDLPTVREKIFDGVTLGSLQEKLPAGYFGYVLNGVLHD